MLLLLKINMEQGTVHCSTGKYRRRQGDLYSAFYPGSVRGADRYRHYDHSLLPAMRQENPPDQNGQQRRLSPVAAYIAAGVGRN